MLEPNRRAVEREDKRVEVKIIVCLSIILVLAVALVGIGLTPSLAWSAPAYSLQW